MRNIFIGLINFYQSYLSFDKGVLAVLTPGGVCKYELSCSQYTKQSIGEFGVSKGVLMGMKRIWSCR